MSTREELGGELTQCLRGVSSLLDSAHKTTLVERNALTGNDTQTISLCCKAQDEILRRIGESDSIAAKIAAQLAKIAGVDPEQADAVVAARAAGEPYGEAIMAEVREISDRAQLVREETIINRTLLNNGLDIVDCCLRTLASDPGPNAYSHDAGLADPQTSVLALDRKA